MCREDGEEILVKISNVGRAGNLSGRAHRFGLAAVSTVALAAAMPSVTYAQAADAAAEEGEIVVTGIKYGIEQSLNIKRNEMSIVEAVSAEEIGKLPDVSIAESISRLPGLTTQRVGGRATVISIRGLAPDFATTLLNGRQQASSGDNRGVEFDQYPSELLSGVVVYKTPDADISGMGLSGTVDLRTVRPLAYGKRAIALNIRGERTSGKQLNDDVRNYGGRLSASYIDQNESGTLGWAIGFAHLDAPSQNRHYKAYNYEIFQNCCNFNSNIPPTDIATFISPDSADKANFISGQELFAYSRLNKRDAGIAILEWEPSSSVHITLDTYYSQFKQRETMRGAQWFDNPFLNFFGPRLIGPNSASTLTNVGTATIGGTLVAVTGTQNGVAPIIRNDYNTRDDELFSAGLNNEFQVTDKLKFIADLSYSSNKRDESITETYAGAFAGATPTANNTNYTADRVFDSIGFDLHGLNGFPTYSNGLNYADAARISLGDRDPWGGWGHDGQTKQPHVRENVYALDLGFEYDVDGFFDSFDLGVNFTKREKNKRVDEFDEFLNGGRAQVLVDPALLVSPTSLGYAGFGNVLAVNLKEALPRYYTRSVFINNDTFNKAWAIDEEVITLRAKATVDSTLFGLGLRGNVGLQVVNQRQQSTGSAINTTITPRVVTPVNVSATYTDVLPSLNMIYDLGGGHRFRFAAAKVLARPRMDELRASFIPSFNVNICSGSQPCVPGQTVNPWSGTGGNAKLEPWRAKAVDLAYEWYITKASYISIAGFYKHLDNYIFVQRQAFDFAGLPIPPAALAPGKIPPGVIVSSIGQINQPANGKGGSIKGIELSGALEFGKITSLLDGFGVIGSYSYTKSSLHPLALNAAGNNQVAIQATRIPGLSGTVYTVTGYFEKNGFQARASYRYRSAFKGEVTALFAARGVTEILSDKDVSAQIGYTFQEGSSLEGLGILLQVNNLTDSRYATRLGTDGGGKRTADGSFFLQDYEKYGRQFLFGVSYHF
jgi:iron complex outermembrane receptor protein